MSRQRRAPERRRGDSCGKFAEVTRAREAGCVYFVNDGRKRSLPGFIEEAGVDDLAGPARAGRLAQIDDGVVGELRRLQGIRAVGFVAEIDAAVQDDVARPLVEWVGKN